MLVGVINKKFSSGGTTKIVGSVINYTLTGGDIKVKIYLDVGKHRMIVYSPSKPEGEVFSDLPKDGVFYPAIQNKTAKISNNTKLQVRFNFEKPVPKGKEIRYWSDDGEDKCDEG